MSDTPNLRKKTIDGLQWNTIGYLLYFGITLLGTALLSRLVTPEEYGKIGILTVLVTITSFLVSLGLDFSVIQNRDLKDEDYSSFFWTNIILGALFSLCFFFCAPLIASFYNQPNLVVPARLYSLIFLIQSIGLIPQAILGKHLDFKKRVVAQIIGLTISFAIAILMAISGLGIWSLLVQVLSYNFINVTLNLAFLKWKPVILINKSSFLKIKTFGIHFVAFQLLDVIAINIDSLLVGKFLGPEELAFFGRSIALIMMPVLGLSLIFTKTFFSYFSALQHNMKELKIEFIRAGELIVCVNAPILLWMAIFSTEIVTILFGDQWLRVAGIISILAIPSILSCYLGLTDSFLTSVGRVKELARASVIEKAIYFVLIIFGLRFGLEGLAYAKLCGILFSSGIKFYLLRDSIQLTFLEWLQSLNKNFTALIVLILTCLIVAFVLSDTSPIFRLFVGIVTSSIAYVAILYILKSEIIFRAILFVKTKFRPIH